MMVNVPGQLLAVIGAASQPRPSITDGFTAGEFALVAAGGILTLAVLTFFIVLFIRASKEQQNP
jgi:hypothetical protein